MTIGQYSKTNTFECIEKCYMLPSYMLPSFMPIVGVGKERRTLFGPR